MLYKEADKRALSVLARALRSRNRITRLRAVSMLSRVDCAERMRWLEAARTDPDESVSQTALVVLSWVIESDDPSWPHREDTSFDRPCGPPSEASPVSSARSSRWEWEYVVEIWREDGLLIGCYLATTCAEDDEYAKRIALGQAIIASAGGKGDAFDTAHAAAFIVGKRHVGEQRGHLGRQR